MRKRTLNLYLLLLCFCFIRFYISLCEAVTKAEQSKNGAECSHPSKSESTKRSKQKSNYVKERTVNSVADRTTECNDICTELDELDLDICILEQLP